MQASVPTATRIKMNSSQTTSRLVKKSPSVCTDLPLSSLDVRDKLRLMKELLGSCYGPTARLKQVHNNIGGSVVTTSTSSVLLQAITSSRPVIGLIKSSVLNHVSRFGDCGLFAAVLCLSLVEEAARRGVGNSAAIRANDRLLALCTGYLQREDCGCRVELDFCSSRSLIALARTVVSSKPTCVLAEPESAHIGRLAVRAFLLTVPCDAPDPVRLGRTVTVPVEGRPVLESAVFPGLLLDAPEHLCGLAGVRGPVRAVLFSASLAGDLGELGDGRIEVHAGVDTDAQILDRLLELGRQALEDGVKLFVCQKVIHPVLQHYLRCGGLIVIERVGVSLMEPLIQLTGAQPVATLHAAIPSAAYGEVHDVSIRHFGSKTMLHLHPAGETAVCSMVLCHRNETMLNELKLVCQKAEHVLRLTLREPWALLGGGCTETLLAAYVRHKSKNDAPEATSALGCSQTEYLLAAEAFCRSLESVAACLEHDGGASVIDLTHAHHWTLPPDVTEQHLEGGTAATLCGCGALESCRKKKWSYLNSECADFSPAPLSTASPLRQPAVLDSFSAKVNALRVAVETANLVLDVRYVIQDVN
ncbi:McKusick-Kaufman/Bardet-Biedl syndromes putative chaperonin [Fundulus heteroclitus]|uniref:McKusick-Kaufman/Bardet-Biedl syndromes putative chaperonin n=1 Tax=Fundulus heteroclitus TaxID=8078 RepID=UPI00165ADBB5|nr:McKusick-Kaufman/Bardet-Biedl syndromes putative chaperonin [Fundulus heteroclitus]